MALNDSERFEMLNEILDSLQERAEGRIILVEGKKDVTSLHNLNIRADVLCIQRDGGPLRAAEILSEMGKEGIILTDWDSRGDRLAADLEHHLTYMCVAFDKDIRERLRDVCIKDIKDIESLDSLYKRLENSYNNDKA